MFYTAFGDMKPSFWICKEGAEMFGLLALWLIQITISSQYSGQRIVFYKN